MLIAVGMYLPFQTVMAIFTGGIVKWLLGGVARHKLGEDEKKAESVENRGLLVASGLVAGEALVGFLLAAVVALNLKFFCTSEFQGKVSQAQDLVARVESVEGTPAEKAAKIAADPALRARAPELAGLSEKKIKDKIAVAESIAPTRCLGTTPDWFGNYWLGFLVILGLGFYMIRSSLGALKDDSGPAPPAKGSGHDPEPAPEDASK